MAETKNLVDILLIEDDPRDAELAIRSLKLNHLINNICHLKDGEEAINYFFEGDQLKDFNVPQLILLDLKLPKISGMDILKKLKSNPVTKKIPVTILTVSKDEEDLHTCYELGTNSYIVKPVDFEKFVLAVKDIGLYWMLLNQPISPPSLFIKGKFKQEKKD